MKIITLTFILFLTLTSCDCQYHLSGIVLDNLTKKPIQDVAIGKTDTTDLNNPFNRKTMTMQNGDYEIYGIAGNCSEVKMFFSKAGYQTQKMTFQNNSIDTILLKSLVKKKTSKFDLTKDFEVLELKKSNDYPSSEKDTTNCLKWTLSKLELKKIIKESRPINGQEWHHLFGHYPCIIKGSIIQNFTEFQYSINSGAWFTISSKDSIMRFGSLEKKNNKFFLDSAWIENDIE